MTDQLNRAKNGTADRLERRRVVHQNRVAELEASSDAELLHLLSNEQTLEHGHTVLSLPNSRAMVFAKLVPLTAREMLSENRQSPSNLFRLPAYYQYRIGTCRGDAWRELQAQAAASDWVLAGDHSGFPLLHHWRVLPIVKTGADDRMNVGPWGGCPAIDERLSEVRGATSSLVLFTEYFPLTLLQWIEKQLLNHPKPAQLVADVERNLRNLLAFIESRGLLHLDAHFANILTDGDHFYLTDFGLALSREFQLDADEVSFFERHKNFDRCTALNSLVRAVVIRYNTAPDWRQSLREMNVVGSNAFGAMPDAVRSFLGRKAPLALMIGDFYARLIKDPTTSYPAAKLQDLLDRD